VDALPKAAKQSVGRGVSLETLIAGVLTVAGFTLVRARAYRILKVVNDVLFYVTLPGLIFFHYS